MGGRNREELVLLRGRGVKVTRRRMGVGKGKGINVIVLINGIQILLSSSPLTVSERKVDHLFIYIATYGYKGLGKGMR